MPLEHGDGSLDLALPADERARGQGQVGGVERPEVAEVAVAQLVQALRVDEILEPVLAEVADRGVVLEKSPRRLGEDDLTAVGGGGDPGGAMDVHAHVSLVRLERLTGVDAHADTDRPASSAVRDSRCRGHRVGRPRERDEEGVALGVDLDAVVSRECPRRALRCSARRSA